MIQDDSVGPHTPFTLVINDVSSSKGKAAMRFTLPAVLASRFGRDTLTSVNDTFLVIFFASVIFKRMDCILH